MEPEKKRVLKWVIVAVVVAFVLVCGFIDGTTVLAVPGAFLLVLGGPVVCGFIGYGLWRLMTGKNG